MTLENVTNLVSDTWKWAEKQVISAIDDEGTNGAEEE